MSEMAHELIEHVSSQKNSKATILALSGDLGAGKTTLAKEIARALGVVEHVSSPTFVIMKIYPLDTEICKFKKLIHIDAYRLQSSKELFQLGLEDICADKNNIIIVEWPEYVPECVPDDALWVKLSHIDEHSREISY